MHRSCVPKILQNTIYKISNNRQNFNENPSMRAILKNLRAQTSEFYEQIEQTPNSQKARSSTRFQNKQPKELKCLSAVLSFFVSCIVFLFSLFVYSVDEGLPGTSYKLALTALSCGAHMMVLLLPPYSLPLHKNIRTRNNTFSIASSK